ncbi:hypothetical protein SASPL_145431 [Salvia splendens]|uniref:Selenium-binding protein 1 n=1 Tax=Salvia splendens TaxID=180675 RepID=A0A8X8Z7N6_SALSN|nr:hypothetical protein SASPL_145431 [Salvia splendens]
MICYAPLLRSWAKAPMEQSATMEDDIQVAVKRLGEKITKGEWKFEIEVNALGKISRTGKEKPDYLATVDTDPNSPTYSKVIHRLSMPYLGDELHRSGWNACSSCHGDPSAVRRFLVLPFLLSGPVDTQKDPRAPSLHKVVNPKDIIEKTGVAYPHTAHCLASGEIMVSCLGDKDGNAEGNGFLLLDSDFNVKGRWEKPGHSPLYGYDFWYQPRHKTMISTSMGAPSTFIKGFNVQHVSDGLYGRHLHVYSWPGGELKQTLDFGNNGLVPLEASWGHEVAISVKPLKRGSPVVAEAEDGTTYVNSRYASFASQRSVLKLDSFTINVQLE